MNRNAAWPAEMAGTSSAGTEPGRQKESSHMGDKRIEMLRGQRKRADTSNDRKGGHILRKNREPLTVNCLVNEQSHEHLGQRPS